MDGCLVGLRYLLPYLGHLLPFGNVFSELEKMLRIDPSLRFNVIQKGNWKWGVGEGMAVGSERKLLEDPSRAVALSSKLAHKTWFPESKEPAPDHLTSTPYV